MGVGVWEEGGQVMGWDLSVVYNVSCQIKDSYTKCVLE